MENLEIFIGSSTVILDFEIGELLEFRSRRHIRDVLRLYSFIH